MTKASARHILVKDKKLCEDLIKQLQENPSDFEKLAKKYSECASGQAGGDLGEFGRGEMVPEFDKVVFSAKVGEVYPEAVETDFGYHIIEVTDRSDDDTKITEGA